MVFGEGDFSPEIIKVLLFRAISGWWRLRHTKKEKFIEFDDRKSVFYTL